MVDFHWTATPRRVNYLGSFVVTYKKPNKMTTSSPGERNTSWDFDRSLVRNSKPDDARTYLRSKEPESPWNTYEVSF